MTGSSNLIIFDSQGNNIQTDSQYSTNAPAGVSVGIADPTLYNKQAFQASTAAYVLAQLCANNGYTITDANPTGWISDLQALLLTPNPLFAHVHNSALPVYTSSTSVTFPYIAEIDSSGAFAIIVSTPTITSTTSAALNGLDTGSISANTYYYPYAVSNGGSGTSNNGILWSKVNSMVTGTPSRSVFNYTYYRQIPGFILTDGSANIIPHFYSGSLSCPTYYYQTNVNPVNGATQVLNYGSSTTYIAVSAVANYVPPISRQSILDIYFISGQPSVPAYAKLRPTGMSGDYFTMNTSESVASSLGTTMTRTIPTNSSQSIDYLVSNDNLYLSVAGCVIDQVI